METQQMMELLLARMDTNIKAKQEEFLESLEAKLDAHGAKMGAQTKAIKARMKAIQGETKAIQVRNIAIRDKLDGHHENTEAKTETGQKPRETKNKNDLKETEATELEVNPEKWRVIQKLCSSNWNIGRTLRKRP
jgi:regulator of replication initiation timing